MYDEYAGVTKLPLKVELILLIAIYEHIIKERASCTYIVLRRSLRNPIYSIAGK